MDYGIKSTFRLTFAWRLIIGRVHFNLFKWYNRPVEMRLNYFKPVTTPKPYHVIPKDLRASIKKEERNGSINNSTTDLRTMGIRNHTKN